MAGEISRLTSCPLHCSSSCLPWLITGFLLGLISALLLLGVGFVVWTFRLDLVRPAPSAGIVRFPQRSRLSQYLNE